MAINQGTSRKAVYTTGEAAEICNLSQQTIIRCFDNGILKGFRIPGSKFRRIPHDHLEQFMRDHGIPTDSFDDGRIRVLVVDDDSELLNLFDRVMGKDDRFDLHTASTGYEAGLKTEKIVPGVVLLDFMLPDINGRAVCENIRGNPRLEHTRIVIISGVVESDEVEDLLDAGADEFIRKPFDVKEVAEKIVALAGKR